MLCDQLLCLRFGDDQAARGRFNMLLRVRGRGTNFLVATILQLKMKGLL